MEMITNTNLDASLAVPRSREEQSRTDLGQDDFLRLMTTQFQNQDPMKPLENGEFLGQLAQFSTVSGIEDMNRSVSELAASINASQTLQAASMIGRSVLVEGEFGQLQDGQPLEGAVDLPVSSPNVTVRVFDPSGALVREIPLGTRSAGLAEFQWDGYRNDGSQAGPGTYQITAEMNNDGARETLQTLVYATVDSVSLSADDTGTKVTTDSGEEVRLSEVRSIR